MHPNGCFGFLHEPTIRAAVIEQTISQELLLAICAASTRFVRHLTSTEEIHQRGQLWADEAKNLVFQRLVDYDIDILACLVLQFHHALANAQFELIRLLAPVAARMAMGLGLCEEPDPSLSPTYMDETGRETRRRLVWACQIFDWFTGWGARSSLSFKPGTIKVRLPTSDKDFLAGQANEMPFLAECHEMGTDRCQSRLGAYVFLMSLKAKVLQ